MNNGSVGAIVVLQSRDVPAKSPACSSGCCALELIETSLVILFTSRVDVSTTLKACLLSSVKCCWKLQYGVLSSDLRAGQASLTPVTCGNLQGTLCNRFSREENDSHG